MMRLARNSSDTSEEIVTESSSSCEDIKAGKNSFIKWTSNLYERFEETQLYRYFYVTGIALVRKAKRIRRRTLRFVRSHRPQIHLSPRHRRILAVPRPLWNVPENPLRKASTGRWNLLNSCGKPRKPAITANCSAKPSAVV